MTPEELKAIRVKLGLSQTDLADLVDATLEAVVRWELGIDPIASSVDDFLLALTIYVDVAMGGKLPSPS
jgi:predicted transcriptional regulator